MSGAIRYFIELLKIRHKTTTPYHPRINRKVENLNRTLGKILTKYLINKLTRA
jgi:transposase InsO family protein